MKALHNCLCLDIGNTTCRLGAWEDGAIREQASIPTSQFAAEPELSLASWKHIKQISYCSVVPDAEKSFQTALSSSKEHKIFSLTAEKQFTLPIDYPSVKEIGSDRIANSYAAFKKYKLPAVVIDLGTATTFDVITETGYAGGVIVPGPQGFLDFLGTRTALLPHLSYPDCSQKINAIGKSTVEAMLSGLQFGYLPMLQGILDSITQEICPSGKKRVSVIQTGGECERFLMEDAILNKALTLEGLAMAYFDQQPRI